MQEQCAMHQEEELCQNHTEIPQKSISRHRIYRIYQGRNDPEFLGNFFEKHPNATRPSKGIMKPIQILNEKMEGWKRIDGKRKSEKMKGRMKKGRMKNRGMKKWMDEKNNKRKNCGSEHSSIYNFVYCYPVKS